MPQNKKNQHDTSPDIIREDALNSLYQKYKKSRSVKKQVATISEIKKLLNKRDTKNKKLLVRSAF